MKRNLPLFVFILTGLILASQVCHAWKITGAIRNLNCFYPKVYLQVISNIDGIYAASFQDIIGSADVDSAGNFTLSGNDLPDDYRFYRLYLTDDKNVSCSIRVGSSRNYILLVLNNNSLLAITCPDICKPFFPYSVTPNEENTALMRVQSISDLPALLWTDNMGESKKQFVRDKKYAELKQYADTTTHLAAGLWAVLEMNIESSYAKDPAFFNSFAARLKKNGNYTTYTRQLNEALRLARFKTEPVYARLPTVYFIIAAILLLFSVALNIYLFKKKNSATLANLRAPQPEILNTEKTSEPDFKGMIEKLTIKEREILKMVNEGSTNKEIAEKLHVEVSTVKTHISNIYQKTNITNRREVAGIARHL